MVFAVTSTPPCDQFLPLHEHHGPLLHRISE
jgi:hypothetical protein